MLSYTSWLYVLEMNPLWVSSLTNIFSYSENCSCLFLRVSFRCANAFKVNSALLSDLWFIFHYVKRWLYKELATFYVKLCPVHIFLKNLIVSIITFLWSRNWQPTPVLLPENFMDRGAWQVTVHGVAKSCTWWSDSHTHIITFRCLYSLEFILCLVLGCFLISFSFSWLKESSRCPAKWLLRFTSQASVEEGSLVCTPSQHLLFAEYLEMAILTSVMWYSLYFKIAFL